MKKLVVVLMFSILIGCGALAWLHGRQQENSVQRVFMSGNIEATEVDLSFRLTGQINTLSIN